MENRMKRIRLIDPGISLTAENNYHYAQRRARLVVNWLKGKIIYDYGCGNGYQAEIITSILRDTEAGLNIT